LEKGGKIRIGKVEEADLSLRVSYAFVLHGPLSDFIEAREKLRSLRDSRLIFNTASTSKLFVVKQQDMEKSGGDKKDE